MVRRPLSSRRETGDVEKPRGRRELIIVAAPPPGPIGLPGDIDRPFLAASAPALAEVLSREGVSIQPLFRPSSLSAPGIAFTGGAPADNFLPNSRLADALDHFFHIDAPEERLDQLANELRSMPTVLAAYVKPPAEPAVAVTEELNTMQPQAIEPATRSPDFTANQGYLDRAPDGIDARFAWTLPGGRGGGVNIIDCEWNWRFTHEDLRQNKGGVSVGTAGGDDNHGTAVLGEFSGDANNFGVTGICSEAFVRTASFENLPTAQVIQQAADLLQPGDLLLLEIHRAGPDASGAGQDGYIAIEWWPDDLAAIRYAVRRGVIVVEAGGNGARSLDNAIYNTPQAGFPPSWRNPFNPTNPGSGAVVVGAGAPPPGTHGRDYGPDRSRLDFSNYGSRIDVQGWGREVTSTGYGDLQGGSNADVWYTDQFSGTSSASPIIVGALGCVQGILRARGTASLTPDSARRLLRETGSPQQDAPGRPRTQRIGNRPDLRALLGRLLHLEPATMQDGRGRDGQVAAPSRSTVIINIRGVGVTINVDQGEGV
jgi:hypothetical protein